MEEEEKESVPQAKVDHTKSGRKRLSIITMVIISVVAFTILGVGIKKLKAQMKSYNIEKEVFLLSDNSKLMFVDNENYILSYKVMSQELIMKGKYRISYNDTLNDEINENIMYEYKMYVDDLKQKNSKEKIVFLELSNEDLYINGSKATNGFRNIYYLLTTSFEGKNLVFTGYNIDNGTKIKFTEQKGEYENFLKEVEDVIE